MQVTRNIAFVLFEEALALNIAGPAEVFESANRLSGRAAPLYHLQYLSSQGGAIRTSSGLSIATQPIGSADIAALDTVMVVGGVALIGAMQDAALIAWIERAGARVRRMCSVCTGAFLLAAAHLLDGRRAATHWASADALRTQFPSVDVLLHPLYVNDGNIWTSAGISAGIDLALTLVESDHDRQLGLAVAKDLVVFLHRPGGQAQLSRTLMTQHDLSARGQDSQWESLRAWMIEHLDGKLDVTTLAARMKMSARTFARKFADWHGRTPAKLVEDLRVEAACRYLEDSAVPLKQIVKYCGFGAEERMQRAFVRRLGLTPSEHRQRFRS